MIGYSGEANFVTRFSLFYPELMHSACAGGGSWAPALPVSRLYGEKLNYPLGIAIRDNLCYNLKAVLKLKNSTQVRFESMKYELFAKRWKTWKKVLNQNTTKLR